MLMQKYRQTAIELNWWTETHLPALTFPSHTDTNPLTANTKVTS